MIAKSDLIILVVSSTLLGVAVYRWDQNTRNVDTSTVLANTTVVTPATAANADAPDQTLSATTVGSATTQTGESQTITPTTVVVEESAVVEAITPYSTYTVRSGDSLSAIAARYNTTVNELRSINGISGSTIFVGQEIQYPNN